MSIEVIRNLRRAVRDMTPRGLLVARAQMRHGFRGLPDEFWARLSDDELAGIADAPETPTEQLARVSADLKRELAQVIGDILARPVPYIFGVLLVASAGGLAESLLK